MDIKEFKTRSQKIRTRYHELEVQQDGHAWTPEQDALAFLTDAGLVGRQVMNQQGSWPNDDSEPTLDYKLAECMWWLSSLAEAHDIDLEIALDEFLSSREVHLN